MNDTPIDYSSFELGGLITWAGDMGNEIGILVEFEHKYHRDGAWILWAGTEATKWSPLVSLQMLNSDMSSKDVT